MRATAPTFTERKASKSEMELKYSVGQKKRVKLSLYEVTKFIQNNRETESVEGHRFHYHQDHQHSSSPCPEQLIDPTHILDNTGKKPQVSSYE